MLHTRATFLQHVLAHLEALVVRGDGVLAGRHAWAGLGEGGGQGDGHSHGTADRIRLLQGEEGRGELQQVRVRGKEAGEEGGA